LLLAMPLFISYWKLAYQVFFHEAAHYNLCKDKRLNDFFANLFWTPFTGLWIQKYRQHHWAHHMHLGNSNDTEISYVSPLNAKSLMEALFGIYLLKTVFRYFSVAQASVKKSQNSFFGGHFWLGIVFMLVVQFSVSAVLAFQINLFAGVCWLISVFVTDPLLTKIRQTLEHRSESDKISNSFEENKDLAVNQIFGNDLFSYYFGAAGFNKHLLHHLDPSISYTCFDEFENFLTDYGAQEYLKSRRTSYKNKFLDCFNW
jgi:fatty acid desaturase